MFQQIQFWHWLALGGLFLIVELLAPGMFFLWMAQAAFITGVLLFLFSGMGWEIQLPLFSVFSVAGIALARHFFRRHPIESDQPLLNRRTALYVGRVFTLDKPIVNGRGKIKSTSSGYMSYPDRHGSIFALPACARAGFRYERTRDRGRPPSFDLHP